jgi:hypothetical protein
LYALLSAFTTLVVFAGGLLRIIIHFTKKNDLISQCTTLAQRDGTAVYPFGFWGPIRDDDVDKDEAEEWCNQSWNHGSWSEIVSMLITVTLAAFWTMIVYSYYRQLLDPSSVANSTRLVPVQTYPQHYNQPYGSTPHLGYGYNMPYAGGPGYVSGPPPPGEWHQGPPPGQWQPPQGPPPAGTFAPPAGAPPNWEGGYSQDKGAKADNPFEDFTETGNSDKPNHNPPGKL